MSALVNTGDEVIVSRGRRTKPYRATVTKVARVWITVITKGAYPLEERFRLDTQMDGSQHNYAARFYTLEQWAERETNLKAAAYLADQGITLTIDSRWRRRESALADVIRKGLGS